MLVINFESIQLCKQNLEIFSYIITHHIIKHNYPVYHYELYSQFQYITKTNTHYLNFYYYVVSVVNYYRLIYWISDNHISL